MKITRKTIIHVLLTLISIIQIYTIDSGQQLAQTTEDILIIISYHNPSNNQISEVAMFNKTLNQAFNDVPQFFDCENLKMFTLQQDPIQNNYQWIISNYTEVLNINVSVKYKGQNAPSPHSYVCGLDNLSICVIQFQTNCSTDYSDNVVIGTITTSSGIFITKLFYNTVCNQDRYQPSAQIQWGAAIIIAYSFFLVFISAKFQFTTPYTNAVVFINYYMIAVYFCLVIIKNSLLSFNVPNVIKILRWGCIAGSVVCGAFCGMVCFGQVAYLTKLNFFRLGYSKGRFRVRVMDILGFIFGVGMQCAWYFSDTNWLLSDIIFTFIYISVIKVFKIGSLKMAVIIYTVTLIVDGIFYQIFQKINNQFLNAEYNIFNNPLFFMVPLLTHIPNRKCQWYFILSMSYPALFMAYLWRFDKNRSSNVYRLIFFLCLVLCSVLWFIVSVFVPFPFPYDLFTVPISVAILLLIANRRDELKDLWTGQFYDEQMQFFQNQQQLLQKYNVDKRVSYNGAMFNNLKYESQISSDRNTKKQQIGKQVQSYQVSSFPSGRESLPNNITSVKKSQSIQMQLDILQASKQFRSRTQVNNPPK